EPDGKRRVYAVGNSVVWYSTDAGKTWKMDLGVSRQINNVRQVLAAFQVSCGGNGVGGFGGAIAFESGDAAQILAVDPSNPAKVFLATTGGALGPTYYNGEVPDGTLVNTDCKRLAGEGSLWVGGASRSEVDNAPARVALRPGPPASSGATAPRRDR